MAEKIFEKRKGQTCMAQERECCGTKVCEFQERIQRCEWFGMQDLLEGDDNGLGDGSAIEEVWFARQSLERRLSRRRYAQVAKKLRGLS